MVELGVLDDEVGSEDPPDAAVSGPEPRRSGQGRQSLRRRPDTWQRATGAAIVAAAPMLLVLVSLFVGGGPHQESADDALITLATRDAIRGAVLLGPYSRFGWHHPGPSYFYALSIPTWLWHGTPTGSWIGAVTIGIAAVMGTVVAVRRVAGIRAGWWAAIAALFIIIGIGPGVLRDPWNPYAVALPVLLFLVVVAMAAAGVPGALLWAAVVGSFAVQTHISTTPLVGVLFGAAAACQLTRWALRVFGGRAGDIPAALPPLPDRVVTARWWQYRRDLAIGAMFLIAEWIGPAWDEVFGSGNLSTLWSFFTRYHAGNGWEWSWRQVTAMVSITLLQNHGAFHDGVYDRHPIVTTLVFVGLAVAAMVIGRARRRPLAVWMGAMAILSGVVAVWSVTGIVGGVYRYLLVWMVVLPILPIVAVAVSLEGIWSDLEPHPRWVRPGTAITLVAVIVMSVLGIRSVANTEPAVSLSDRDIASDWRMVAPIVGPGHGAVLVGLADGARWPAAAGLALELERHGHPSRVDASWTFLFGDNRRASGSEPVQLVLATSNPVEWPPPTVATFIGVAGPTWLFVVRQGPQCWSGWLPFGGPACPLPVAPSGPSVPAPA